jgi:ABC-type arginine transport system ATPase subunit
LQASAEPAIDVHGLRKSFGSRVVVDDFAIRVERGQIFGFLGPNGSGKTTTIRMLCGLLTPDAGEGRCLGFDLRTQSALIKREVGYMTQRFSLYEDLSIQENLDFVAVCTPCKTGGMRSTLRSSGWVSPSAATSLPARSREDGNSGWPWRLSVAQPAVAAARRAHGRRRSQGTPGFLGSDPYPCRRWAHGIGEHALHG